MVKKEVFILAVLSAFIILLSSFASALLGEGTQSNPFNISSCLDLNRTRDNMTAYYQLTNDINCDDTKYWDGGAGWDPIGNENVSFNGTLIGGDYSIINLNINRINSDYVGFFGGIDGSAYITNLYLENISIKGKNYVGGLWGWSASSSIQISNVHITGILNSSAMSIGGVGARCLGAIINSSFDGNIFATRSGDISVGGLIGQLATSSGLILNSFSNVNLIAPLGNFVGGLVGNADGGNNRIYKSYSLGFVLGNTYVGGLLGHQSTPSTLINSYSRANVTGDYAVGGLIGQSHNSIISTVYSTGNVSGVSGLIGGLIGSTDSTCTNSFWDNETSNKTTSPCGALPKTTIEMKSKFTYSNWDFIQNWTISPTVNEGYPFLRWQRFNASYSNFPLSTDFNTQPDITNIDNAKIANSNGSVEWLNSVSMTGADINSNVVIGSGFISINASNLDATLNSSAKITVNVAGCENIQMYHLPVHVTDNQGWLDNRVLCNATTTPKCEMISCSGNTLVFNITHLDGGGGEGYADAVPEFSDITAILALAIVGAAFFVIRNRKQ